MRLEALTVRGFMTAFAGKEVIVPIGKLPDGLIAIVGDNGAGKSTLMEAAAAGIYRQFMSRDGDLKTYAQDRDSAIETSWRIGDDYIQSRLTVDGIKGGASAALWKSGDQDVKLNDGKVSTYDAAIARVFPPLHVFKASAFAAQNKSGSFVHASKKDRRDIFNAFLNLDRLVAMSETAKLAAAEVEKVRTSLRSEIQNLEAATAGETAAELAQQLHGLAEQGADATRRRDELAAAIVEAEGKLALLADQVAAVAAAEQAVDAIVEQLAKARTELAHHRNVDAEATVAEEAEISKAQRDRQSVLAAIAGRIAKNDTDEKQAISDLTTALQATLADIDAKLAGNAQIQGMADEIRAAVATLAQLELSLAALRGEIDLYREHERELADKQAACERAISAFTKPQLDLDRAKADAVLLEHVPCHGSGEYADCQLLVNATTARARIAELETTLSGLTGALQLRENLAVEIRQTADAIDRRRAQLRDLEGRQAAAQPKAAYADKLAASKARVDELKQQRAAAERDQSPRVTAVHDRHATTRTELVDERQRVEAWWDSHELDMQRRHVARRAAAAATSDRLSTTVQALSTEHVAAVLELDRVRAGGASVAALRSELEQLRADRDAALTAIATASSDAAAVRRRIEELQEKAARVTVLRGRLARLDTELLEWQLLQQALDRDGLPALEVDQAGPEISALTNQILADCFDSRFSVELVTQVAKADGKGMKDEFTLLVTDNHTGQIRDIADLSGGEEVIVAEAFMNAISLYINARSRSPMRTWFRDETTGALTKENTQRYVRMLRKVQAMGNVSQIVFISHDPDAYALADAQIRVAGGEVSTVLPPYMAA